VEASGLTGSGQGFDQVSSPSLLAGLMFLLLSLIPGVGAGQTIHRVHMHRLAAVLLVILAATSPITSARAVDEADASRAILLFVVNPPDENAKKGVIAWIQAFKNNIRYLLADSSSEGSRLSRSIKVVVTTENVDDVDPDMLEASFARQPSLQVLSTVGRYAEQSTYVDNQIYLGDLKGSLPIPYVQISQEILPGRYKITREAVAVVTLYAYAMAMEKVMPAEGNRFAVCRILDRANMYRQSDLDPEARSNLQNLFKAISAELEARACGGKR
jgi:hypothetical protein